MGVLCCKLQLLLLLQDKNIVCTSTSTGIALAVRAETFGSRASRLHQNTAEADGYDDDTCNPMTWVQQRD